jgi:transcriptional regulator GlxA family with amidase domain
MSSALPTKIGIILFPGFQLLDAAGPLDAFSLLSQQHPLEISILGATLSPISTANAMQSSGASIVPTHTFEQARELGLDVLVLPGGLGTRTEENVRDVVKFVKSLELGGEGGVRWMLTVCTGSEVLARTGWLDGKRATTNKRAFNEVCLALCIPSHRFRMSADFE